jgi:hypothetical protein
MIAVFDNFLDENLLNEIKNDPTFFQDPGVYYYWGAPWNGEPANTLKKRLIEKIWLTGSPLSISYQINGFEYWTGIQTANPELGHKNVLGTHYDKDEAWFAKTGEIVTPVIGTVFYPGIEEFEGGDLAVYTDGLDKSPEIVKAKPNRLIIFQAGQDVHEVLPVTKGTRHAIAINLWQGVPYSKQVGEFKVEG